MMTTIIKKCYTNIEVSKNKTKNNENKSNAAKKN